MGDRAQARYRRYTAVLREDNRNYAITRNKRPRGKAAIEIRGSQGILHCWVKNLRFPEEGYYPGFGLWIVGRIAGKGIPVYAGIINVNREGVGERTWSFQSGNVDGNGLDIELFDDLEVRVTESGKETPEDRILGGDLELVEVDLSEEPKMEKVSPFGSGLPYHQWWKFYPGNFQDLIHNPLATERQGLNQPGDPGGNLSSQGFQWPENVFQTNSQECIPFNGFLTGPVFRGHQLVGLECDRQGVVKFLVHGIPGRFCLRDQPYGGLTGYVYWHPLPGQHYQAGDYGYWLIHINPATGEVVFPKKLTVPPDCEKCGRSEP